MDWSKTQAKIAGVLVKLGQVVSLKRGAVTLCTAAGVFTNAKIRPVESSSLPGTAIAVTSDKELIMTPLAAVEPRIGDIIVSTQGTFKVQSVKTTSPAGTVLVYTLTLR